MIGTVIRIFERRDTRPHQSCQAVNKSFEVIRNEIHSPKNGSISDHPQVKSLLCNWQAQRDRAFRIFIKKKKFDEKPQPRQSRQSS